MNRPDARALIETLAEQAQADAAAAGGGPGSEVPPDILVDYLRRDLDPEAEARVERRLVGDPAAARALLDLAELEEAARAADEAHLPDPETRTGWRDLAARLPRSPRAPRHRSWLLFWLPSWLPAAAAALLLLAAVGLTARLAVLERALDTPRAVGYVELTGARGGAGPVAVAPGSVLGVAVDAACPGLHAEIAGPRGSTTVALAPSQAAGGVAMIALPRRAAAGEYRLRLAGCEPPRTLAEHSFRVVPREGEGDG